VTGSLRNIAGAPLTDDSKTTLPLWMNVLTPLQPAHSKASFRSAIFTMAWPATLIARRKATCRTRATGDSGAILADHPSGHAALVLHDAGLERIEQRAAQSASKVDEHRLVAQKSIGGV